MIHVLERVFALLGSLSSFDLAQLKQLLQRQGVWIRFDFFLDLSYRSTGFLHLGEVLTLRWRHCSKELVPLVIKAVAIREGTLLLWNLFNPPLHVCLSVLSDRLTRAGEIHDVLEEERVLRVACIRAIENLEEDLEPEAMFA